jgi:hypothetical protein
LLMRRRSDHLPTSRAYAISSGERWADLHRAAPQRPPTGSARGGGQKARHEHEVPNVPKADPQSHAPTGQGLWLLRAHRRRRTIHNAALNRGLASQQVPESVARTGAQTAAPNSPGDFKNLSTPRFVSGTKSLKHQGAPRVAIELQQIGQYALRGVQWSACRHIIPSVTNVE